MASVPEVATRSEVVTSLARGMHVIEILSRSPRPLSLAEVARQCDTTRATARRLLLTLVHLDYVTVLGSTFTLRPKVMDLGDAYLASSRLPAAARPHLRALSEQVQDTCSLTVLDGGDVVYVDRVTATRLMTVDIAVGTRFPAYATSTGRVLLSGAGPGVVAAYLDHLDAQPLTRQTQTSKAELAREIAKVTKAGYAIADQELSSGLRSVAAPIRDREGVVVAAVNVSTQVTRTPLTDLRTRVLPLLLETASRIEDALIRLPRESTP